MEIVVGVLVLLALALVVKAASARRAGVNGSDPKSSPKPPRYEPPTFRVVALGASRSGKTVFLSSMFHSLNFPAPGRSYYLETDARQRVALGNIYSRVSDPAQPWPPGTRTGETREFVFDCVGVDKDDAKHTILRMSYLDYAGELLVEEQEAGSTALDKLAEKINDAHALLAMIDGQRLLQLLRKEPGGHDYFQRSLRPMLGFMHGASCPIHLVVTKWDLLRDNAGPAGADDKALLDAVIAALMGYEHIKALVYAQSAKRIVRLIPVSAVGSNFADLDGDGEVVKRSDGEMHPTNIEVPLCAVLPDLFGQVESSLDESMRSGVNADMLRQLRKDAGAVAASVLGRPAGAALRMFLQGALGKDVGLEASTLFIEWLARPSSGNQPLGQARTGMERQLADLQRLRTDVLDDFRKTVLRLEAVLPNSQLSAAW
jgi:hypothetical protein